MGSTQQRERHVLAISIAAELERAIEQDIKSQHCVIPYLRQSDIKSYYMGGRKVSRPIPVRTSEIEATAEQAHKPASRIGVVFSVGFVVVVCL